MVFIYRLVGEYFSLIETSSWGKELQNGDLCSAPLTFDQEVGNQNALMLYDLRPWLI